MTNNGAIWVNAKVLPLPDPSLSRFISGQKSLLRCESDIQIASEDDFGTKGLTVVAEQLGVEIHRSTARQYQLENNFGTQWRVNICPASWKYWGFSPAIILGAMVAITSIRETVPPNRSHLRFILFVLRWEHSSPRSMSKTLLHNAQNPFLDHFCAIGCLATQRIRELKMHTLVFLAQTSPKAKVLSTAPIVATFSFL